LLLNIFSYDLHIGSMPCVLTKAMTRREVIKNG
jgi:hypothetical protein